MSLVYRVCEGLLSKFEEMMDNLDYWVEYDTVLMQLSAESEDDIIDVVNKGLMSVAIGSAKHDAFTDVASCLEENDAVQYAGKFKY